MQRRLARSAVVMAAVTLLATACAASPTPTPTGFESEEEAFAAAEETYRAYVEATNRATFDDPTSAEAVYAWLTGDALSATREEFTTATAEGWVRSGESIVSVVEPHQFTEDLQEVSIDVCVDVSAVEVTDADGRSLVAADRPDEQAVRVSLVAAEHTSSGLAIESMTGREDGPTCAV